MKYASLSFLFTFFFSVCARAQIYSEVDSLKKVLQTHEEDSNKVQTLRFLSIAYEYTYPDTAYMYIQEALDLSRRLHYKLGEARALNDMGSIFYLTGNYPQALEAFLQSITLRDELNDAEGIAIVYCNIGQLYLEQTDYTTGLNYFFKAMRIDSLNGSDEGLMIDYNITGDAYERLNMYDSALFYQDLAYEKSLRLNDIVYRGPILTSLGNVYRKQGKSELAYTKYHESIIYADSTSDSQNFCLGYLGLAYLFQNSNQLDSSLYYGKMAINAAANSYPKGVLEASLLLSDIYQQIAINDSALKYLRIAYATNDSLFNQQKLRQLQALATNELMRQQEMEAEKIKFRVKIRTYIMLGGIFVFMVIAYILFRNNKQKQKANKVLIKTLSDLKSTQAQLIQSEKMASLGELTAGIAHEIQNPLNFVNNFSELNEELLTEMKDDLDKGKTDEAIAIANDLIENQKKIYHHGKRADAIVKGMLQHSRSSSGKKEPVDINELCDEYLRLAYHGMRAKDKSFIANFKTDFDHTLDKIQVAPQDIGRVLLNIINNAFYAVNEKAKQHIPEYEPTVAIMTKKINGKIKVSISDNGNGIPEAIKEKIFQPFFTTKPTGQGTGLGLSLSYDIIKAHDGELKVESIENTGTEFIILLPLE